MKKYLFIACLSLFVGSVFAQHDLIQGYLVLESNDTVFGLLKNKTYYNFNRLTIISDGKPVTYTKKNILIISTAEDFYIKNQESNWGNFFYKKDFTGAVNIYTYKRRKYFGKYDSDINGSYIKPSIKFYCDDYPAISQCIDTINKHNVEEFLVEYTSWKVLNPESKSFYETNMHEKKFLNLKLSFLLPGAGIEFGLAEKFTLNTMIKSEVGYNSINGWVFNPFVTNQLRFYHNLDKRKNQNIRTYKYSGNYICLLQGLFLNYNTNFIGIEYGWQRTVGKHWYYNLDVGVANQLNSSNILFLYDFDFGFNF